MAEPLLLVPMELVLLHAVLVVADLRRHNLRALSLGEPAAVDLYLSTNMGLSNMKTYAYIPNGVVYEIIHPVTLEGDDIPINQRYTPQFVAMCVDITAATPQPVQGWSYDGEIFTAPSA
ncbi:hypothetical protein [Burkholderia lata]|uniref:hypothetical protein n=1 Tax=Burkholderia lata (strain ATCC 17760 / DSM 23089 / LMG 22485 / NCIMB 9086 / R18194 / 383) TaxID=482957 RepID=UPI0015816728|nr:hypothetical protein [Burkholderia lata]